MSHHTWRAEGVRRIAPQKLSIMVRDKFVCQYCGINLLRDVSTFYHASIDHLTPRSKGGDNEPDNLVTCCRTCNELKSDYAAEGVENAKQFVAGKRLAFTSYLYRVAKSMGISLKNERSQPASFHDDAIAAVAHFTALVSVVSSQLTAMDLAATRAIAQLDSVGEIVLAIDPICSAPREVFTDIPRDDAFRALVAAETDPGKEPADDQVDHDDAADNPNADSGLPGNPFRPGSFVHRLYATRST